ncbi:MAG: hypothetical protein U5N86_00925 [Planctomycetota bacterium]|nr:hypothetical protein [Planctomycetota bacterium]
MSENRPYCYLLSPDDFELSTEMFANPTRFRGVEVTSESSNGLKMKLPGDGSAYLRVIKGDELAETLAELDRQLHEYSPESAVNWMRSYLKGVSTAVIMEFEQENFASQQAAEEVRCAVWEKAKGLWHYPSESYSNEHGALVMVVPTGGIDGKRVVATLKDGDWVEYTIDLTNSVRFDRFKRGQLPPGIV